MRIRLIILFILVLSKLSYPQWQQQNSGVSAQLYDVKFTNENTGWVCGEGVILKTTNGGDNWEIQNTGVNNKPMFSIYPVNDSVVYCVGWFETILKTTNAGNNWIIIENGPFGQGHSYFSVFFLNENTGWIGSTGLATRKTTDGGQTFIDQFILSQPRDIYFKDSLNGVICDWASTIGTTSNGGNNWNLTQYCTPGIGCEDFDRFSFINDFTGYVAGREGTIFKTTNFGLDWDSVSYIEENTDFIRCVEFRSDSLGWAGGGSQLFKTTTGGLSWVSQIIGPGLIPAIYAVNDTLVWAVAKFGKIWHTTTGGDTTVGIHQIGNEIPLKYNLFQNYPNPFNPSTKIRFEIPNNTSRAITQLRIYDMLGREVALLVDEVLNPGTYEFTFTAHSLSSGIYYYKIKAGNFEATKRMVLVK